MPWSMWTTRSPGDSEVASARKLDARLRFRGRASRSPRMSVSEITARSAVSKPASTGSTTRCGGLPLAPGTP